MAASLSLGFPLWLDGLAFAGELGRQIDSSAAFTDGGSAAAVAPLGGVIPALGANLAVTPPVSGLTVNVAAGFVVVPSATSGQGAYYYGLMSGGSLTVASNSTGSTRKDLVLATVSDVGSSSSVAKVQYVTGTTSLPSIPASSVVLAEVDVTNSATSITSGMITDKRSWVVARGGILPVKSAATSPAGPGYQLLWNLATSSLMQASPVAGAPASFTLGSGSAVTFIPQTTTYETAGTYTWVAPVTGVADILLKGAGAGGAGSGSSAGSAGGGGGEGETAEEPEFPVLEGQSYTVVVGAGGTAGTSTGNGGNGADTTFNGTSVVANGASGGHAGYNGARGDGGTGSTNTIHEDGQDGQQGIGEFNAGPPEGTVLGDGGNGGGGGGGQGGIGNEPSGSAGQAATNPGCGGGGGAANFPGSGAHAGGAGADGMATITVQVVADSDSFTYQPSGTIWRWSQKSSPFILMSATFTADGSTDYVAEYHIAKVGCETSAGTAKIAVLLDGVQVDSIQVHGAAVSSPFTSMPAMASYADAAFYTSSARLTRPGAGPHVMSIAVTKVSGNPVAASPWSLRASPVVI